MHGDEADSGVGDELRAALRGFLSTWDPAAAEGSPPNRSWWDRLTGLGVLLVPVPEPDGGLGLTLEDAVGVFEDLGAALAPGPLVWSQLSALLPDGPGTSGRCRVVAGVDLTTVRPGDPVVVPNLAASDAVLVLDDADVVLHERDQVDLRELDGALDPGTPVAELLGRSGGRRAGCPVLAARLRRVGTLLTAATQVGVSRTALEVATAYAKERHQFGRPIGSFQALKHLLADAYTRTELARAAVRAAAEFEDAGEAAGSDLDGAKLLAGVAADQNARTAVQVFGGMGFAWETPPHRLLKRAWVLEHEFGTTQDHAAAVAEIFARPVLQAQAVSP